MKHDWKNLTQGNRREIFTLMRQGCKGNSEAKGFSVTLDGTQVISVMRDAWLGIAVWCMIYYFHDA